MGGQGSGRHPSPETIVKRFSEQNKPSDMVSNALILPNFSGDHSAGKVLTTPVNSTDIVNKDYVDSLSLSGGDHSTLTNLTWDKAGHPATFSGNGVYVNGVVSGAKLYSSGEIEGGSLTVTGVVYGSLISGANCAIPSEGVLYLDGGGDTYLTEPIANNLQLVAGGVDALRCTASEVVINQGSVDLDFRVESDNLTRALFVRGSDGRVSVGRAPTANLGNTLEVSGGVLIDGQLDVNGTMSGAGVLSSGTVSGANFYTNGTFSAGALDVGTGIVGAEVNEPGEDYITIIADATNGIKFFTNGTNERLEISSAGAFDFQGSNLVTTGDITGKILTTTGRIECPKVVNASGANISGAVSGANIYTSGKIGIGQPTPSNPLEILSDTIYQGFRIRNTSNVIVDFGGLGAGNDNGGLTMYNAGSQRIQFVANGNSNIAAGNNLGIGYAAGTAHYYPLNLGGGAFFIANQNAPATPTGGAVLFASGGAMYVKGSSGTVTRIGIA